jgi:phage-related protein
LTEALGYGIFAIDVIMSHQKAIVWMGSSKKILDGLPDEVQDEIGYALDLAQHGRCASYARRMKG